MAGQLTLGTKFLMKAKGGTGTFSEVHDMLSYPDLLPQSDTVDVTTLAHDIRHYIPGVKDVGGALSFGFLFDPATNGNFATIKAAEGTIQTVQIQFDDALTSSGTGTTFEFDCYVQAQLTGKGVNEAVEFVCNCYLQSDITYTAAN